ncbi:tetratricopeptide repeat protein [Micromonospora sp. NPDC005237]|uniref:ATP-binding protein n=1 Tax=Micromonospora sp. NPDC005237 TaxID=3155113 RepID=UPI0033AB88BE
MDRELADVSTPAALGAALQSLRETAGLTTREMDSKTRLSDVRLTRTKISKVEGGELPRLDWLRAYVNLCGVGTGTRRYRAWENAWTTAHQHATAGTVTPDPDGTVPPRQLPMDTSPFVGRKAELDQLTALHKRAGNGVAVISAVHGTAGIGKTTLALRWAHKNARRFTDGHLYVNLRGFSADHPVAPAHAVRELLDGLGVPAERIPAKFDAQLSLYRSVLSGRRLLLVLDNAATAEQVRPLLPGSSSCFTIVTSRSQLTGLVARDKAVPLKLDVLSRKQARELLDDRIGRGRLDEYPEATATLLTMCGGLPLALVIAAARIMLAPDQPLDRLVAEATGGEPVLRNFEVDDSESDLPTVFSWSYRTLNPDAARLFRYLGLVPGPDFTVAAAASLVGAEAGLTARLMRNLADQHLIEEYCPGRYRLHDLLRAYANDLSEEHETSSGRAAAHTRVIDYYLQAALHGDRLLDPLRETFPTPSAEHGIQPPSFESAEGAAEWFEQEHESLSAAARLAAARGRHRPAFLLPWSMTTFLHRRGYWREYADLYRLAVEAAEPMGDPRAHGVALRNLANALTQLGEYDHAMARHRLAVDCFRKVGDIQGLARTERAMGYASEQLRDFPAAEQHASTALGLYRQIGDRTGEAQALNALGWYRALQGDYDSSLTHCSQALALFDEVDDLTYRAHTLDSIGFSLQHLKRYADAAYHYQEAIAVYKTLGDRYYEAETLHHLGDSEAAAGNASAAQAAWQDALTLLVAIGHPKAEQVRAKLPR